jgi:hypothetical protein
MEIVLHLVFGIPLLTVIVFLLYGISCDVKEIREYKKNVFKTRRKSIK